MNWKKWMLMIVVITLVAIQFIQPAHNKSPQVLATDVTKIYGVPDSVQQILQNACYDCHSNNTQYPWYANIQPVGWMLSNHVVNGKKNLNFSELGKYSTRKQANKFRAIGESITEGTMPISSYTLMHKNARLTDKQKKLISSWTQIIRDSLMAKH